MSEKSCWYACAVLALSLLVPGSAFAQDNPVPDLFQAAQTDAPAAECLAPLALPAEGTEEAPAMTLKELERKFGAHNVCGARCGPSFPHCNTLCGDYAFCDSGYCVWW